jgi:molecular chaperone GrpE
MTTTFERNRKAAKESGAADVAKSILGVSDDLGRILRMLETTEGEAFDVKHIDALRNGLKMTRTNLDKAFRSKDIIELNPKGDTFDPNLYEAVTVVQDETFKNKEIVSVSQTGFVMGDRILRPAKVVVNKK